MKNISILFLLSSLLFICSCDNDDDSPNCQGIDCLPEATQTGAGTFGCLVNGEPFYAFGGVQCQYQLIDGEYYFAVGFARGDGFPELVSIESNQKEIQMGINQLAESGEGKIYGKVIFNSNEEFLNRTDEQNNGFLEITNFDINNNIISGVFEFSILNQENGVIYNITDGRFDSFYAQ
ncbi:hypothetical protein [Psychroflexus montanilacus]|uniref:hypothetical protein n=1 Tax=Psychroflexus montanilacus TaxID=2873598 RepID=UPI001CC9762D|nr:hypothetical protein [Psychroflexus montanilacus]MBZ9650879.1 hypothetical protein [Psychroflexus montanilacus]